MYYMNGVCYEIPRILDTNSVGTYALLSKDTSYSNPPNDQQQVNNTLTGTDYFHYQYGQMGMSVQYSKNVSVIWCHRIYKIIIVSVRERVFKIYNLLWLLI